MIDEASGLRIELHTTGKAVEVCHPENGERLALPKKQSANAENFDDVLLRLAAENEINNHS